MLTVTIDLVTQRRDFVQYDVTYADEKAGFREQQAMTFPIGYSEEQVKENLGLFGIELQKSVTEKLPEHKKLEGQTLDVAEITAGKTNDEIGVVSAADAAKV